MVKTVRALVLVVSQHFRCVHLGFKKEAWLLGYTFLREHGREVATSAIIGTVDVATWLLVRFR